MDPVYVLFGTESGNTVGLAKRAGAALSKAGLRPNVLDMLDFDEAEMPNLRTLLVITSTYGNGDPPSNAEKLLAYLMRKSPSLPKLQFSVCGLGDTTYDRFAQCGKDFDRRLEELSATRLVERQDCDVDYDEPFEKWLAQVVAILSSSSTAGVTSAPTPPGSTPAASQPIPRGATVPPPPRSQSARGTRTNPLTGVLLKNTLLTPSQSTKKARHVELRCEDLQFQVGDSVGIWPVNDPAVVDTVIKAAQLPSDTLVKLGSEEMPLQVALSERLDIVTPDVRLAERCLGPLAADARKNVLSSQHVVDLLRSTQASGFAADEFVNLLRPLIPRPYSAASSPLAHPGNVHLLVDVVEYELNGSLRKGVASSYLGERRAPGDSVRLYCHPSPHFRLADPNTDIVMIGPGTGVAPFRAFLQEREVHRGKGRAWLFFGSRHRATDFYYQSEWDHFRKVGVLHHLDVAFSRDHAQKYYVQHRMLEVADELYRFIAGGAVVYVCGDAHAMAPDVQAALTQILARGAGTSAERALESLEEMAVHRRFQKDVY